MLHIAPLNVELLSQSNKQPKTSFSHTL